MTVETTLRVTVHYPAAEKPYSADNVERGETVGQFKTQVLHTFGLVEGPTERGNVVTYALYHQKSPLDNPAQALGSIADDHEELQLKLSQEITQG